MKPMGDVVIERKHAPRASSHLSGAATQGCSPPSRGWASQPRLLLHLVATPGPRPYGSRIFGASLSPVPEIPARPQVNTHVFSTAQKPQAHFHATSTSPQKAIERRLTGMILCSASWTSTRLRVIVQSSLRSIWSRSLYIAESCANSGDCRSAFGRFLSVILRFLSSGAEEELWLRGAREEK